MIPRRGIANGVLQAPLSGGKAIRALFNNGEQGVWYDPSDLSTLFQDAAGTTPVTGVGQPVGLMLDKSKNLSIGSELLTNGNFETGTLTGWTNPDTAPSATTATSGGAQMVASAGSALARLRQSLTVTAGTYIVSFDVRNTTGNTGLSLALGNTGNGDMTYGTIVAASNGTYRKFIHVTSSLLGLAFTSASVAGSSVIVDNVSVTQLNGTHATQATAAARPVLSARVNLALSSEAITVAAGWSVTNFTVTQNAISAPSPYLSSTRLTATAIADNPVYTLGAAPQPGTSVNVQIAVHHGSLSNLTFLLRNGTTASSITTAILSSAGVLTTNTGGYSVSSLGSGWYLVKLVISSGFTTGNTLQFYGGSANGIANGSFFHLTGFQFQYGQETRYQRINTSTDYDVAGFPMYLSCDGVDDGMATASIDFTATDKMTVWAGIRKLSDTTTGTVVELSANLASNSGSFLLRAPRTSSTNTYGWFSMGTALADNSSISGFTSPISSTVTGIGDIPASICNARVNGVTYFNSTSQGIGNYGNYPLYLFRRGGTTLPFNGNFYGCVIRGAASNPKQIAQVEKYLAAKTGVIL